MSASPIAVVVFLVIGYLRKNLLGEALMATFTGIHLDPVSRGPLFMREGTN